MKVEKLQSFYYLKTVSLTIFALDVKKNIF